MSYAELQLTSHYSFLRGASSAEELFTAAANLGIDTLGVVDRNTVAGMVRAWKAAQGTGIRLVPGCRLDLVDGTSLLVWPEDKAGWSRLMRLLTRGKARRAGDAKDGKLPCRLDWDDVAAHAQGLLAALVPDAPDARTAALLGRTREIFGDRSYCTLSYRRRPGDTARIAALDAMAQRAGLTPLATGDVLYASPDQRMLQEVMTAIREKTTVDALGFRRERFADRHLKGAREMERLFSAWPGAIAATQEIAGRCRFDLGQLRYQYPEESLPGMTAQQALAARVEAAARDRYPDGLPEAYARQRDHELGLIEKLGYAPYFLTVNAIVAFARSRGILCQGRGSAANSVVCFLLGITSIDPIKHELLFERFISENRDEPPDIDVDFEHERREEVIQWIYRTYGHQRAALTAVVSRYRARGAVREVGKALGLPEDMTGMLAGQVWGWSNDGVGDRHAAQLNMDATDPRLALTLDLARQLIGTPRHLSQHPGGFVLTEDRLDDLVPIEPAAMEDRRVIEWEKDDIEALRFMKVDVLGLGMLGCMRRAFDLLSHHKGRGMDLADPELQEDDPQVYAMISKADTLGTFQIESRAQMSMLPRMKPKEFYDIVIQVAIVRPGPIQGDMVHPYLRRREKLEKPEYPKPELKAVLEKTLGVPLFQEQAMKVAIVGAGFTPAEADELRRSMATFKFTDGVGHFRDRLVEGMVANGYARDFADRTFRQIEGFGSYGFPESHAASFAKIAYASSWMKCHHPDVFCCALLNAQPMGFYAPAQIVRDAREHGVEVRPVCVNDSRWDCHLIGTAKAPLPSRERGWGEGPRAQSGTGEAAPLPTLPHKAGGLLPVRLGLRQVRGLSNAEAARLVAARAEPFTSVEELWRRTGLPPATLEKLANADAFRALGLDRRQALWAVKALGTSQLPLFAAADRREGIAPEAIEPAVRLVPMAEGREVVEDYRHTQLSLRAHPLAFLRGALDARGILPCEALARVKDGRRVEVAGIILVRQKPGSAKGVLFITIEDEGGIANIILWPDRFEAQRRVVLSSAMIGVKGRLQREGEVVHIIADVIEDMTPLLGQVGDMAFPHRPGPGDGATHGGTIDPRDRKPGWAPAATDKYHAPFRTGVDPEDVIRVRSHDFH